MGMGLSSLYMAPIINTLLENVGISSTFTIVGVAALVSICFFAFILPISPAAKDIINKKKAERSGKPIERTPEEIRAEEEAIRRMDEEDSITIYKNTVQGSQALKTKEFWIIVLMYVCMWMPGQMVTSAVANICSVQAAWEGGARPGAPRGRSGSETRARGGGCGAGGFDEGGRTSPPERTLAGPCQGVRARVCMSVCLCGARVRVSGKRCAWRGC